MNKRYRYITCGLVFPDEPVNNFRLIGPSHLTPGNDGIRIELPDDMELEKYSCDTYSTTQDERTIRELNPVVMIRINNKLVRHKELEKEWLGNKVQPHEFTRWVEKHDNLTISGCRKFGLITHKQYKFYSEHHRDCIVLDRLPNDDEIDDFKIEIPVKKYENLIKKMREFIRDYHEFSDIHRRELDKYSDEKLLVEMFWDASFHCENTLACIEKGIDGSDYDKSCVAMHFTNQIDENLRWEESTKRILEKYGKSASKEA